MSTELSLLFLAVGLGKKTAAYLGVVESLDSKIASLTQSELNVGVQALQQAANSATETESLLREARGCFNKATSLETTCERKATSWLGLALCHDLLGDRTNCKNALAQIDNLTIEAEPGHKAKIVGSLFVPMLLRMMHLAKVGERMNALTQFQKQVRSAAILYGGHES